MKQLLTIQTRRTERLLAVHAAVSATLHAAIAAPSPARAAKVKRRQDAKSRPPGSKPNRPWWEEQLAIELDHPADHQPPPLYTHEAGIGLSRTVTLTTRELHILLRAAMPPGRTQRTRRAHARLRDAIDAMTDQLAALDSNRIPDSLIAAARMLATATDLWLDQAARARQAEDQVRARWGARVSVARAKAMAKAAGQGAIRSLLDHSETPVRGAFPLEKRRAAG